MDDKKKGYEITLGPPSDAKKYFVEEVDETPCPDLKERRIRHVVNLAIHEVNGRTKLKGTYPGKVKLLVGYRPGESSYNVYLYDSSCKVIKTYLNKSLSPKESDKFGSDFEGYFTIEDDEFPDPNVGVGP